MLRLNQTIEHILIVSAIIVGAYLLSRFLKYLLGKYIEKQTRTLDNDATSYNFLKHAISFLILIAAIISIFYTIIRRWSPSARPS